LKSNKIGPIPFIREMILLTKIQQMKKTSIRLVLALGLFAITFGACKKDKDEAVSVTKENLAGKYKISKVELIVPGAPPQDMLATFDDCEKDDVYTLNANMTAKYEDVGTKCDANGSNTYDTNWTLDGNAIVVRGNSMDYIGNVKSYDGKTLVIEGSYDFMGVSMTFRATLAKQ
jgi:hypothetical protein